jgi:hypothetical protein
MQTEWLSSSRTERSRVATPRGSYRAHHSSAPLVAPPLCPWSRARGGKRVRDLCGTRTVQRPPQRIFWVGGDETFLVSAAPGNSTDQIPASFASFHSAHVMSTAQRGGERRHQSGAARADEAQYTNQRSMNGGGTRDRDDDDDEPYADAENHSGDDGESDDGDGGATSRYRPPPPHHASGNRSPNADAMDSNHASSSTKSGRSAALPHSSHASQSSHRPARHPSSSSSSSSLPNAPAAGPPRFSCTLNRTEMMTQMLQALHFGKDQLAHLTFQELGIKVLCSSRAACAFMLGRHTLPLTCFLIYF